MANEVTLTQWSISEVEKHAGMDMEGDPLWVARFNATHPDAVYKTYLEYMRGGSQIIYTNTYQASIDGYMKHLNLSREESIELMKTSVRLAHQARDQFLKETCNLIETPKIFGVIGPYGAHLNDGSEYTGNYAKTVKKETLMNFHKDHLDTLLDAGVDGIICLTIPCLIEAETIVELMESCYPTVKFIISFSAKSETEISSDEKFSEVVEIVWNKAIKNGNMLAIGLNCLQPVLVTPLLISVKRAGIPFIVAPGSGEIYSVEKGWHGKEMCTPIENFVEDWINLGVKYLGLCCRTFQEDFQRIRKKIEYLKNVQ